MTIEKLEKLAELAIQAALEAGNAILSVYNSQSYNIKAKDDKSPLTEADLRSHVVIVNLLNSTSFPVLSEEGRNIPYEIRKQWEYYWLVDPLDGTKEFIKRNGEFTVNIALVHHDKPVLGVILTPVTGMLYYALSSEGSYKLNSAYFKESFTFRQLCNASQKLEVAYPTNKISIVASRSHLSDETKDFIDTLSKEYKELELVSVGSSLKFCLVAEGAAHIYPRLGPTMEWDIAAGISIAKEAGAEVVLTDGTTPIKLNKEELLNPSFIVKPVRMII